MGDGFYQRIARYRPKRRAKPARWVFLPYDQLRPAHPLLEGPARGTGIIYVETSAKPARRPYHKQKLTLLLSAMRHNALARGARHHPVLYWYSERWYDQALEEARERFDLGEVEALAPAEAELREPLQRLSWLKVHPNTLFLTDSGFFHSVFKKPGYRRLETFYRAARRRTGLLMDGDEPAGGIWNLDRENRRTWRGEPAVPERPRFGPDRLTREVLGLVESGYPQSFGSSESFDWPVTAEQAEAAADHFFDVLLGHFGPYEDAMALDEPALFHSRLSASINLGHLDPLELCRRAEAAFREGRVPLASAEGFVRQILGWREFLRHVFGEHRELYATANALEATAPLPSWYWGEASGLCCLDTIVKEVLRTGHSHHITRLMVLANLATLLGVNPHALNHWFWIAYVDAYDWVVTPNVLGMGTWADGGVFATKPYVASGRYIKKMGPSLCAACAYDPDARREEQVCPFGSLYWDFLERHASRFASNPRMGIPMARLKRMSPAVRRKHRARASEWRRSAAAARN